MSPVLNHASPCGARAHPAVRRVHNCAGVVTNLTESISVANVDALVKGVQDDVTRTAAAADAAIKGVERRAEGDLTNLVQELSKTVAGLGDKLVGAIQVRRLLWRLALVLTLPKWLYVRACVCLPCPRVCCSAFGCSAGSRARAGGNCENVCARVRV